MKKILVVIAVLLVLMLSFAIAEAAEVKDTWQVYTLRNRILGEDFSFYLPEGEWSISNLNISACTNCYFNTDGASIHVYLLGMAKDKREPGDRLYEEKFSVADEGCTLVTAGDRPAYLTEDGQIVIHLGDLPLDPDTYYLRAVIDPEDEGKGEEYLNEIRDAVLAGPFATAFDTGFPADKLVDDGGTMFYPMQITFNGKEIPLTHTIMNDSCLHVSGVYEDENGAQFTFYTTSAVSKKTVERGIEKGDYTEKAYGTYLAGEKRSYGTLYAQVWMGEYGFKYVCSYKNADESDANYETASALIQALMASGEYHELPAE